MINVSDAFKTAIKAQSREIKGLIEFEILDIDANTDATASATSENEFSKKDQLFNQNRLMSGKYASFETDYWKLDGSFVLPPKTTESGYEVGWWSDELSGVGGVFAISQVVTCDFTIDHSSIGITITFDTQTNEYAKDFTIRAYDSSAVLIDSVTVTDNTLTTYIWENNLSNFRQIEITITKWCKADRRARIAEIDFGIIKQYSDSEIINMNILEELDTTSNTTTANEIKFTLDNQSKDFNILNPAGIYPYLQRKQKIKPYLGVVVTDSLTEYLKMGVFYLNEWKSDEGTLTATFTARDLIDVVSDDDFPETSYTDKTLKYILEDILADAGITEYSIDTALDAIIVTGTVAKSKHREAIQVVALAGMAVAYCDRDGILQVKQLTTPAPVDTIDYNNVYSPPQIILDKLINTINVKYGALTYALIDPDKPTNEQTLAVTVDNPLIGTLSHAQDVANWLLVEYKKRFIYEINWRMDPSLEPSDIVTIEDDFSEDKTARITRNEFQYNGALSGKTNGRGGG